VGLVAGLTNEEVSFLGKSCCGGMPSLLAGWNLIWKERSGERTASSRVLCEVESRTGEALSSIKTEVGVWGALVGVDHSAK